MSETQELLPMPGWMDEAAVALDQMAATGLACRDIKQGFRRIFMTAQCVSLLKGALTPEVMKPIMDLQGSPIGFKTDKDIPKDGARPGYPLEVVKEALVAAVMAGLLPCGNQFNIIGGRMYVTKEGFTYILSQAGVEYSIEPSVPRFTREGEAIVTSVITWKYGSAEGQHKMEIPIRVNKLMGTDAVLGKADRKAKAWLWNHLMHTKLTEGDTESAAMGTMRDVTPERGVATATQGSPMKASPMRTATARVVEAEVRDELPEVRTIGDSPAATTLQENSKVAPECNFAALLNDLRDAGRTWERFSEWLAKKGVQLPPVGNAAKHDQLAALIYSQAPLLSEMIAEGWIVRG